MKASDPTISLALWTALILAAGGCEGGSAGGPGVEPPSGSSSTPGSGFVASGGDEAKDGGTSAVSDAASAEAGSAAPDAGRTTDAAEVDPDAATLDYFIRISDPLFFDLPINSIRYAVSGRDEVRNLCITAVWFLSTVDEMVEHCDDFGEMFPYIVIAPGQPAGCWDYGTNATLLAAEGCVDWAAFGPEHADRVELELSVVSPHFTGTIRFDNTP